MVAVDNRVVGMTFDNKQFEQGISQSQKSLEKLNQSLQMKGATQGLSSVEAAANKLSFSPIQKGVDTLSQRFSALGIAGMTVIQNLTTSAMQAGAKIANALTSPLIEGGKRRALNIEAAKFQIEGLGYAWDTVKEDINYGVKDTAYGLDVAAKAAGQLLASNVEVGDSMKTALRGISGVAAMTNSEYEDISNVFTTVAGNGRLMASELNRLSARGINAAATLGKYLGKTEAEVREMTSKGQIDFATFAAAMDDAFGAHAKEANKTFTGALSNMKAALSRIGADFATPGYENLRDVMNALTPLIDKVHDKMKPLINLVNDWMKQLATSSISTINNITGMEHSLTLFFGAFTAIGKGIGNIGNALSPIFEGIRETLEDFIPKDLFANIFNMANSFKNATSKIQVSETTITNFKRAFSGLFSVADLVARAFKGFLGLLKDIAIALTPVANFILELAANLGDLLTGLDNAVKAGDTFDTIFGKIGNTIKGFMGELSPVGTFLSSVLTKGLEAIVDLGSKIAENLGKAFGMISDGVGSFIKALHLNDILNAINALLMGGVLVTVTKFVSKLQAAFSSGPQGLSISWINPFTTTLNQLKFSLQEMQAGIKATSILKIAAAVGILAISMKVLSEIDPVSLAKALSAITVGFSELLGMFIVMEKYLNLKNVGKIQQASMVMITLGIALNILASAVKKLSSLNFQELTSGLVGVGVLCMELAMFMNNANFDKIGIFKGIGLMMIAGSLVILSNAVSKLASLNVEEILKGLTSVLVLLAGITAFTRFSGDAKGLISTGLGMMALATAMVILSDAITKLGKLSITELVKGLSGMGAALLVIAGSIRLMPKSLFTTGLGLMGIATATNILASALQKLGSLSVESIFKSLITLAGALGIIAGAAMLMKGSISGAVAIQIFAGALAILAPVLMMLGSMSLEQIGGALLALAGAFTILGVAGMALGPLTPVILALSAAMAILGAALLASGAGLLMFSIGFATLAASGAAGAAALVAAIESIGSVIPTIVRIVGETFIGLLETIASNFDALLSAAKTIFGALLQTIIELAPQLGEAAVTVVSTIISSLREVIPQFIELVTETITAILEAIQELFPTIMETISTIIMSILTTLAENAEQFAQTGANIVINFINGIASKIPEIVQAAFNLIISFINGLADGIRENSAALGEAVGNLLSAIIEGAISFIMGSVGSFLEGGGALIQGMIDGIMGFFGDVGNTISDLIQGAIDTIGGFVGDFFDAAGNLIQGFIDGILGMAGQVWDTVTGFAGDVVNALTGGLDEHSPSKIADKIGQFFVQGFINGVDKKNGEAQKSITDVANDSIKTMEQVNKKISGAAGLGFEINDPVITPVVDISKAKKNISDLSDQLKFSDVTAAFNASVKNTSDKASKSKPKDSPLESALDNAVKVTQNFSFNQTNNSPKALSRVDIYRDTINQFKNFSSMQKLNPQQTNIFNYRPETQV